MAHPNFLLRKFIMKIKLLIPIIIIIILIIIITIYTVSDVRFLTVIGTSMNPDITQNDIVVVVPTDTMSLEIGDVITYKLYMEGKDYMFTHRIVNIENGIIMTKGDNMPESDGYDVMSKDVVGRVVGIIPYIGGLIRFVHTTTGYLIFIFIPSILLIIREIKRIVCKN